MNDYDEDDDDDNDYVRGQLNFPKRNQKSNHRRRNHILLSTLTKLAHRSQIQYIVFPGQHIILS